ncbi:hypothetical protein ACFO0N_08515 [Halobium salinum]|uniref:DUF202 domain-containing protein n=1 Tax=Halobium salinum TaxID=1364940 RepID=A0ABD5PB79_9EURY|nr:hypothetical protein [Halobium salinum]
MREESHGGSCDNTIFLSVDLYGLIVDIKENANNEGNDFNEGQEDYVLNIDDSKYILQEQVAQIHQIQSQASSILRLSIAAATAFASLLVGLFSLTSSNAERTSKISSVSISQIHAELIVALDLISGLLIVLVSGLLLLKAGHGLHKTTEARDLSPWFDKELVDKNIKVSNSENIEAQRRRPYQYKKWVQSNSAILDELSREYDIHNDSISISFFTFLIGGLLLFFSLEVDYATMLIANIVITGIGGGLFILYREQREKLEQAQGSFTWIIRLYSAAVVLAFSSAILILSGIILTRIAYP